MKKTKASSKRSSIWTKETALKVCKVVQKSAIILFISVNLGIMYVDGLPDKTHLGKQFTNFIARYQAFAMNYQPWSMFAPNPMNTNAFLQAEIEFEDGTKKHWVLPRQTLLSGMRRVLVGDRYRLFGQESLVPNSHELLWQDISKFVTRQVTADETVSGQNRKIGKITFFRFSNVVQPPPHAPFIPHGQLSTSYKIDPVFFYVPTVNQVTYDLQSRN